MDYPCKDCSENCITREYHIPFCANCTKPRSLLCLDCMAINTHSNKCYFERASKDGIPCKES